MADGILGNLVPVRQPPTICKQCNGPLEPREGGSGRYRLYCTKCRTKDRKNLVRQKFSLTCLGCGNQFEGRSNGKYCSDKCRAKCRAPVWSKRARRNVYVPASKVEITCEQCGGTFLGRNKRKADPRNAQKYCSKKCLYASKNQANKFAAQCVECGKRWESWPRAKSGLCKQCSCKKAAKVRSETVAIRRIAQGKRLLGFRVTNEVRTGPRPVRRFKSTPKPRTPKPQKAMLTKACEHCGTVIQYRSGKYEPRFCSRVCIGSTFRVVTKKPTARKCVVCDVLFTPLPTHYRVTACSDECRQHQEREQKNAIKARHRVKSRSKEDLQAWYGTAFTVFKRDGWRCQACGCDTPKRLRGTYDDNAPELDHVIPVSKGGSHTADNLQCLCRLCNLLKSDMSMDEFMSKYVKAAA